MVQSLGWDGFFVLTFVAALPGLGLVWLMRKNIDAAERSSRPVGAAPQGAS
jgi:hypothetical protein